MCLFVLTVEPRANLKFPQNQSMLDKFKAAGIPMRNKLSDGIVHVKLMLLAGQNKVVFTGSNFGDATCGLMSNSQITSMVHGTSPMMRQ